MLEIETMEICPATITEVVRDYSQRINVEISCGETGQITADIKINFFYSEVMGANDTAGEKCLKEFRIDTDYRVTEDTNFEFHLLISETVDDMLKEYFPNNSQDERNIVAQKIMDKIEKFLEEEEIDIDIE